jgi:hypothetical protein
MSEVERLLEYSRNEDWYLKNVASLRTQYPDRYVAVHRQRVVASAAEIEELQAALAPEVERVAAVEFVSSKPACLLLCA